MKKYLSLLVFLTLLPLHITSAASSSRIRVKLSAPELQVFLFKSNGDMNVKAGTKTALVTKGTPVVIVKGGTKVISRVKDKVFMDTKITLEAADQKYVEVTSWKRTYAWDKSMNMNDNKFLGSIDVYPEGKGLLLVNDILLSDYMKGIAEVPETDQSEKRKALAVLSRSYAAHYTMTDNKKFDDPRYNAADDPQIFQKYLGYGWQLRSPQWQKALTDTQDEIMKYNGEILRAAYSSCTGTIGRRKTPVEAGWNKPYFEKTVSVYPAVVDPLGIDLVREASNTCGHGVGLSGLGATNMAKEAKTYKEIIDYYYDNYIIEKLQ